VKVLLSLAIALVASTALAEDGSAFDYRIATMSVPATGFVRLVTAAKVTQTILFRRSERVLSVEFSDPNAFTASIGVTGDRLAVTANTSSAFGVMSVRTNLQIYRFELITGAASSAPAVVRLVDGGAEELPPTKGRLSEPTLLPVRSARQEGSDRRAYKLTGSPALRPISVNDDGQKTYIEWGKDQAMPATFALGPTSDEQIVDGYVRGGLFTIDRVYETLIFRIDKESAKATRLGKGDEHG
jgi:type IV secretion system protein VirB9